MLLAEDEKLEDLNKVRKNLEAVAGDKWRLVANTLLGPLKKDRSEPYGNLSGS
jgi:hypothetical protein